MPRFRRLAVAAAISAASLAAQPPAEGPEASRRAAPAPARARAAGMCQLASGEPWAGAHVVFFSRPFRGSAGIVAPERIETRSDARGRFRAELAVATAYDVWAWSEEGTRRASAAATHVFAGKVLRLVAAEPPAMRVEIAEREHWSAYGPLRYSLVAATPNAPSFDVELDTKSGFSLPSGLPDEPLALFVCDRDGRPLRKFTLPTEAPEEAERIELGKPLPVIVHVKSEDGTPCPQARLLQTIEGRWVEIGTTGANGCASFVPFRHATRRGRADTAIHFTLRARAEGFADGAEHINLTVDPDRDVEKLLTAGTADATITCFKGAALHGKVEVTAGEPAVDVPLLLYTSIATGPGSYSHYHEPTVVRTGADGSFRIPGIHHNTQWRLCAVLPAAMRARLGDGDEMPLCPEVWLAYGAGPSRDVDLGRIALAALSPLDVSVRRADRLPAAFPVIAITDRELHPVGIGCVYPWRCRAGKRGRLRILMPPSELHCAGAGAEGSFGVLDFDHGAKGGELLLTLEPSTVVEGIVRDTRGRAVGGATVSLSVVTHGQASRWPGQHARLANDCLETIRVETRPDGKFRSSVLCDVAYRISARIRIGKKTYRTSSSTEVAIGKVAETEVDLLILGIPETALRDDG